MANSFDQVAQAVADVQGTNPASLDAAPEAVKQKVTEWADKFGVTDAFLWEAVAAIMAAINADPGAFDPDAIAAAAMDRPVR